MNSLRFPLEEFLFPPLALSEHESAEYERTAHILLANALDEYDRYNREDKRRVNRAQWTPVKKRERLTVFKSLQKAAASSSSLSISSGALLSADAVPLRRGRAATAKGTAPLSPPRGLLDNPPEDWSVPTLLQVGCIPGTLDDVMYGMATFDATDMLLEASYTPDEALDAEMLCEIQGPTPSDPFRFLGVKWLVLGNPPGINIVVRPRDMVFLEATGVVNRAVDGDERNVERIGYLVMHSVHLPGHGPLLDKKIVRARTSSCFLFKQLPFDDAVDVFMTSNFDPSGSVAETLAIQSAAHTLTYCGQVTDCAYGKKLAWLLRQRRKTDAARSVHRMSSASSGNGSSNSEGTADEPTFAAGMMPPAPANYSGSRSCAVCSKEFGSLFSKRASRCALCQTALCSSCHVKKKVSFPGPIRKEIDVKTLAFCSACLARAGQLSTLEVARHEVAARRRLDGTLASLSSPSVSFSGSASLMPGRRRATDVDLGSKRRNTKFALDQIHLGSSRDDARDDAVVVDDGVDLDLDIQFEIADRVRRRTSSGATSSNSRGSSNSTGAAKASARKQSAVPRVILIDADDLPRISSVHDVEDAEEAAAALPPRAPAPSASSMTTEQAMLAQIAELRNTAESVYQYARLNTEAHLSQSASAMSQLQALALDDEGERDRQFMSARGAPVILEDSNGCGNAHED